SNTRASEAVRDGGSASSGRATQRKPATGPMEHGTHAPPEKEGSSAPPPARTTAAGFPARMASRTVNTEPRDGPQRKATTPAEVCASRRERARSADRPALALVITRPP